MGSVWLKGSRRRKECIYFWSSAPRQILGGAVPSQVSRQPMLTKMFIFLMMSGSHQNCWECGLWTHISLVNLYLMLTLSKSPYLGAYAPSAVEQGQSEILTWSVAVRFTKKRWPKQSTYRIQIDMTWWMILFWWNWIDDVKCNKMKK